jgi:hypothetical protein
MSRKTKKPFSTREKGFFSMEQYPACSPHGISNNNQADDDRNCSHIFDFTK